MAAPATADPCRLPILTILAFCLRRTIGIHREGFFISLTNPRLVFLRLRAHFSRSGRARKSRPSGPIRIQLPDPSWCFIPVPLENWESIRDWGPNMRRFDYYRFQAVESQALARNDSARAGYLAWEALRLHSPVNILVPGSMYCDLFYLRWEEDELFVH